MTWDEKIENIEICKRIAARLEACHNGDTYRCPHCGNVEDTPLSICCCGDMGDFDEWDQVGLFDTMDIYDIEYRIDADSEYRSVEVMVAGGGPTIYIDTQIRSIRLYWGGDEVMYPLSYEVSDAMDEMFKLDYEASFSRRF